MTAYSLIHFFFPMYHSPTLTFKTGTVEVGLQVCVKAGRCPGEPGACIEERSLEGMVWLYSGAEAGRSSGAHNERAS